MPLIQTTPFSYITCTYLPLNDLDIANDTIFLPSNFTVFENGGGGNPAYCKQLWNVTTPSQSEILERYHLTDADLVRTGRIMFSRGQYDPTSAMGPQALPSTADRKATKILYVSDMAPREALFAPATVDRKTVVQARATELETIKAWLGWAE